jgi:hypothetical protein
LSKEYGIGNPTNHTKRSKIEQETDKKELVKKVTGALLPYQKESLEYTLSRWQNFHTGSLTCGVGFLWWERSNRTH